MRVGNDTTIKARARIESESIGVAADTLPITREEARLLWQRAQEAQAHDKGPTNLRLWAKRASIVLYVTNGMRNEESVTGRWGRLVGGIRDTEAWIRVPRCFRVWEGGVVL